MKRFVEAERLVGLLQRRSSCMQRRMQRQREALTDVDRKLADLRSEISRLRQEISEHRGCVRYDRGGLMRARGKQAVIKLDIACRKLQEASLIEHRERIDQELLSSKQAVLRLDQRQNKHREWIARGRLHDALRRESTVDAELGEGRSYASQFYK
ncbi:chromosome segregation ATPase [Paraburkholderia youngii]|uniref:BsaT protein n=1 Tax=Paraburkholderia youngii TaxID=2782701 RepID=UPI003D213E20